MSEGDTRRYVRFRGRVLGPFTDDDLKRMVRRGQVTRAHELSEDRTTWSRAGDDADLFPRRSPRRGHAPASATASGDGPSLAGLQAAASQAAAGADGDGTAGHPLTTEPIAGGAGDDAAIPASLADVEWYVAMDGKPRGPMATTTVVGLSRSGEIGPTDLVWRSGLNDWIRLDQSGLPLTRLPSTRQSAAQPGPSPDFGREYTPAMAASARSLNTIFTASGIVCGAAILVAMHIPFVGEGETVFWWDLPQTGASTLSAILLLLTGLTCCMLPALAHGHGRAIPMLALGGLWFLMLIGQMAEGQVLTAEGMILMLMGLTVATLWATTINRSLTPDRAELRIWQAISGGVLAAAALLGLFTMILHALDAPGEFEQPPALVFAAVLVLLSYGIALAAGICGLCSINPRHIEGLAMGVRWLVALFPTALTIGFVLLVTAAWRAEVELAPALARDLPPSTGFQITLFALRLMIILVALFALTGLGLAEMLAWNNRTYRSTVRAGG